jgi:hypothetical protein
MDRAMSNTDTKPWPAHWPSRELYLAAIPADGGGINAIFRNAEPGAQKEGKQINFGFASHAVKRLLKEGALVCEDGIYRLASSAPQKPSPTSSGTSSGFTAAQVEAAIREHFTATSADPDEITDFLAGVFATLGATPLPESLAEITEPDPEPMPPPMTHKERLDRIQLVFSACLAALPTTEAEAVTDEALWSLVIANGLALTPADRETVQSMFGPTGYDERREIRYCGGATGQIGRFGSKIWRDPNPPPRPKPSPAPHIHHEPVFAPKLPETEEEREAKREKQKRILANMCDDDLAALD